MSVEWFHRLGDIPGLDYDTPAGIVRSAIPGHDTEPEVNRVELSDGTLYESLSWPRTVAPPPGEEDRFAHLAPVQAYLQAFYHAAERQPADQLIQRIHESLELPGRGSDYHFALQQAASQLRSGMLEAPEVLSHVEALAWLDIRLVLAYPQAASSEVEDERFRHYIVEAFDTLINLYSTEGFLNEALEVARLAQRLNQGDQRVAALEERLATIRGEDDD